LFFDVRRTLRSTSLRCRPSLQVVIPTKGRILARRGISLRLQPHLV